MSNQNFDKIQRHRPINTMTKSETDAKAAMLAETDDEPDDW